MTSPSSDIEQAIGMAQTVTRDDSRPPEVTKQEKRAEAAPVPQPRVARPVAQASGSRRTPEKRSGPPQIKLDFGALARGGYLTPETPKGHLTEQYRRIKRPLLANLQTAQQGSSNVVVVTSSIPGEGKTYTAINLAMSLALERDKTVLLLDADVIKRSASQILNGNAGIFGLTDVLDTRQSNVADAIRSTNVADLRFMASGSTTERSTELLSSHRMRDVMKELRERYPDRLIVVDSPPMLAANEASAMADYAGQVVFVVREGSTPQADVKKALAMLPPDQYVGIVLNRSRSQISKAYKYGYR